MRKFALINNFCARRWACFGLFWAPFPAQNGRGQ